MSDAHYAQAADFFESEAGAALRGAVAEASLRLALPTYVQHAVEQGTDRLPELVGGMAGLMERLEYPEVARAAGVTGRVTVSFVVDETGVPTNARFERSASPLLDAAAVEAVLASRYTPAWQHGRTVKVRYSLPIHFVLAPDEPALDQRP